MTTREEMHQLVWSQPMTKVAQQLGVSGSYLARVCTSLGVPRPERGYWAKLQVGKASAIPPLPEPRPGDPLEWSKGNDLPTAPLRRPVIVPPSRRRASKAPLTGTHGLLNGARTHFESGRAVDEGAYLKPYKKLLVDITTSRTGLDKALILANDLFNALESADYRVTLAHEGERFRRAQIDEHEVIPKQVRDRYYDPFWHPRRPTVVYAGSVAIGLSLVEMSESVLMRNVRGKYIRDSDYIPPKPSRHFVDHTWTTTKDIPSGRFRLMAYAPYHHVSWSTHWQETDKKPLTQQIPAIVKAMKEIAIDLADRLMEADRQSEISHQAWLASQRRWKREEDQRLIQASIKASEKHLDEIFVAWTNVMNLERFFQNVESQAADLPTSDRDQVISRLRLAREFSGSQNPLEFFIAWKTPLERHQPRYFHETAAVEDDSDDE